MKRMIVHFSLWSFLFLIVNFSGCVSKDREIVKRIHDYLHSTFQANEPGGAVIIAKDGKTFFKQAYGMADLELSVPAETGMVYAIGSMTKQFTSVAVLMLAEEHKLNLDDDIRRYLPDYPAEEKKITIENLLTHTSGIIDLFQIPEWLETLKNDVTPTQLTNFFKDKPLLFNPGEGYQYSNSGYVLLGLIIEKASGQTYEQFINDKIFARLGMNQSYIGSQEIIMPKRVKGYFLKDQKYSNAGYFSITQQFACGSIWSNVDDLVKWNSGLLSEKLLKKETLNRAFTSYTLKNGKKTNYGYGWEVGNFLGKMCIRHGGSTVGFNSYAMLLLDDQIYIAVLTNSWTVESANNPHNPQTIATNLCKLMLGKTIDEQILVPIALDEKELEKYIGVYEESKNNYRIITKKGNQLYQQKTGFGRDAIYPLSPTEFFWDGPGRLEFVFDDAGKVIQANWRSEDGTRYISTITDLPIPEPKQAIKMSGETLQKFTGKYSSNFFLSLQIDKGDNCLIIHSKTFPTSKFYPESELKFFLENRDDVTLDFTKNNRGEIDGFIMNRNNKEMKVRKVE